MNYNEINEKDSIRFPQEKNVTATAIKVEISKNKHRSKYQKKQSFYQPIS